MDCNDGRYIMNIIGRFFPITIGIFESHEAIWHVLALSRTGRSIVYVIIQGLIDITSERVSGQPQSACERSPGGQTLWVQSMAPGGCFVFAAANLKPIIKRGVHVTRKT